MGNIISPINLAGGTDSPSIELEVIAAALSHGIEWDTQASREGSGLFRALFRLGSSETCNLKDRV